MPKFRTVAATAMTLAVSYEVAAPSSMACCSKPPRCAATNPMQSRASAPTSSRIRSAPAARVI